MVNRKSRNKNNNTILLIPVLETVEYEGVIENLVKAHYGFHSAH